ncbi:syndapin isoform c [Anaeramoeba flamelloides]|uniref:Syndapin isoform c n=1 Tax=Anaeramoeba flamelloides TaxID=1746091 RepID=A0AAV7ZI21_9EUKA|nr:syndapin isoform c [Anaeramoeba flamelloides]
MSQTNNNSEHHFYPILWNSFEEMNKTVHQSIQHLKEIHSTFQDFGSASQQNSSKLKKLFQSFQQRVEHESQEAACWNGYKFETQTSSEHEKQINKVSKQIYNQIAQFLQTYQTKTTKVCKQWKQEKKKYDDFVYDLTKKQQKYRKNSHDIQKTFDYLQKLSGSKKNSNQISKGKNKLKSLKKDFSQSKKEYNSAWKIVAKLTPRYKTFLKTSLTELEQQETARVNILHKIWTQFLITVDSIYTNSSQNYKELEKSLSKIDSNLELDEFVKRTQIEKSSSFEPISFEQYQKQREHPDPEKVRIAKEKMKKLSQNDGIKNQINKEPSHEEEKKVISLPTRIPPLAPQIEVCRALYTFEGNPEESELSFKVGDIIQIIKKSDQGWWHGKINDTEGMFPENYTYLIEKVGIDENTDFSQSGNNKSIIVDETQNQNNDDDQIYVDNESDQEYQETEQNLQNNHEQNIDEKDTNDINQEVENKVNVQLDPLENQPETEIIDDYRFVKVLYDFKGDQPEDLSLEKGEILTVIEEYVGWLKGMNSDGHVGLVSTNYIENVPKDVF